MKEKYITVILSDGRKKQMKEKHISEKYLKSNGLVLASSIEEFNLEGGTEGDSQKPTMNAKDSMKHIQTLQTIEEVTAFLEGEERKTVLSAGAEKIEELKGE